VPAVKCENGRFLGNTMFCALLYARHPVDQEVGKQREQTDWGMGMYEDVVPAFLLPTPCCIRQIRRREL